MTGVACASITITPLSPIMIPELGSPSAVNAYKPLPSSVKEMFFSVVSAVEAKPLAVMVLTLQRFRYRVRIHQQSRRELDPDLTSRRARVGARSGRGSHVTSGGCVAGSW